MKQDGRMTRRSTAPPVAADVPPALLDSVFPFHLAVDRELLVVQTGKLLRSIYPKLNLGALWLDLFALDAPLIDLTYDQMVANADSPFVLRSLHNGLVLRGQVVASPQQDRLFYLGSPWMANPSAASELGLDAALFALDHAGPPHRGRADDRQTGGAARLGRAGAGRGAAGEFRIQVESDLRDISEAAKASDFQELMRLAHRLKGASTTVGMARSPRSAPTWRWPRAARTTSES